jgi:SAM-dependent methyltransferase
MSNDINKFYQDNLQQYGSTAKGVGWKNEEAQQVRFNQLFKLVTSKETFSINDLGCGVGDFADFLLDEKATFIYNGYDLMPEMIQLARDKFVDNKGILLQTISNPIEMTQADYTIASGIFNIRFDTSDEAWLRQILETITVMYDKSNLGFAFNVLSIYSDPEFRKSELFYADPLYLFDFCKRTFSRNVALLHDYGQYDFTIIVRKQIT